MMTRVIFTPLSISTKVTYAKGKGLLGYFAWHVGADKNFALSQTGSCEYIFQSFISIPFLCI
jgi:GH18 family chitinase